MGKEESAPMKRIFAIQADQALSFVIMCAGAGGACFLSTWSFYKMVEVMNLMLSFNADQVRADALLLALELGIYALVMTGLFSIAGFFNGVAGSSLTAKL